MDSGDRPSTEDADDVDDDSPNEPGHDGNEPSARSGADAENDDGSTPGDFQENEGGAMGKDDADETVADTDETVADADEGVGTDDADDDEAAESTATETATAESTATETATAESTATETATAESTLASPVRESTTTGDSATKSGREYGAPNTAPDPEPGTAAADDSAGGPLHRFLTAKRGPLMWIREMLSSAAVVLAIGLVLFAVSGVWPPMVAVESGSMEPNMVKGDLIFVTEPGRFAPDAATNDVGVVTYQHGQEVGYGTFGKFGSVIVYRQPGRVGSPIIHRARLHVEAGENWYDRADKDHLRADNCKELTNCPAPHAGFITKGDANPQYDQANGIAPPVKAEWVTGVARVRIPYLGWVRLIATGQASPLGITPGTTLFAAGASAAAVGRRSRGVA